MIGNLILKDCIKSDRISEVRTLVRKPSGISNIKLNEFVMENFKDYTSQSNVFKEIDIAFFCLGVYTGQVSDDILKQITVDYAVSFGKALEGGSPHATLCLLSGAGADRTEKSLTSFARYKGMAENQLSKLKLKLFSFRPAYIYPVEKRQEPNFLYTMMRFLYPLVKILGNKYSVPSTVLASTMLYVGLNGASKQDLENQDILDIYRKQIKENLSFPS